MLDFRKLFLALVVLMIASTAAFAQPLSCTAQAAGNPAIRAEGVTETVGDVLIICSGGTPNGLSTNLPQVNIQVFTSPSINITSRLHIGSGPGTGSFSEALLFIDEPVGSKQAFCGSATIPASNPVTAPAGQPIVGGVCGAHTGGTVSTLTYDPDDFKPTIGGVATYRPNAFQARQLAANSLIWQGVPFDPPGTVGTRVLRLTNVRVNASQLGVPAGGQASVSLVVSTSAASLTNPIALPITNPAPQVAVAQNSMVTSVSDPRSCLQCESANSSFVGDKSATLRTSGTLTRCDGLFTAQGGAGARLRFTELFPSAFRRRNLASPGPTGNTPPTPISQSVLGAPFNTETGSFYRHTTGTWWPATAQNGTVIADTASRTLGLADHGTRLIARFNGVQSGIELWVESQPAVFTLQELAGATQTGVARLVSTDANGAGAFNAAASQTVLGAGTAQYSQVAIVGGSGQAVWEILDTDTNSIERVQIRTFVAYRANTTNNLPSLGTATFNGNLAPISTVSGASNSAPLPRFIDTGVTRNFVTMNSCRTNLLFPFVTNQGGFDTGLAISNTSKDPFGTSLQTGACTINYYGNVGGSNVTLAFSSPSITGGEHFVWSLANGGAVTATAGFQGYIIAQCAFQYAHGYAFISDLGAQRLAQGYLALVMDDLIAPSRTGSISEGLSH